MATSCPSDPAGRVTGTIAPVEVSLWAQPIRSTPSSPATTSGAEPGSASMTCGASNHGASLAALANFDENSPKDRCADFFSIRPKVAASQKAVAPPSDRMIS